MNGSVPLANAKHEHFCQLVSNGESATQGYILAGYSSNGAKQSAARLLTIADVCERIDYLRKLKEQKHSETVNKVIEETGITKERVITELAKLGFYDPRNFFNEDGTAKQISELDDVTAAAIVGIEVFEEYEGRGKDKSFIGYTKKYKLADKRAALVDIGKHLGMFIDRKEVGLPGDFDKLDDDELERSIEEAARAIDSARTKSKAPTTLTRATAATKSK